MIVVGADRMGEVASARSLPGSGLPRSVMAGHKPRTRCRFCHRVLTENQVYKGADYCTKPECKRARRGLAPA